MLRGSAAGVWADQPAAGTQQIRQLEAGGAALGLGRNRGPEKSTTGAGKSWQLLPAVSLDIDVSVVTDGTPVPCSLVWPP